MPKKKLHNHPVSGFIPGIYNFCDRWCEKCSYKANCLSYTMEKKFKEREGEDSERTVMHLRDSFWNYWEYICRSAYDVVQDIAKERGVGIEDIYLAEPLREEGLWHKFGTEISDDEDEYSYIETFDIVNICQLYEVLAEECLDEIFGFLDEQDWKEGSEEVKITEEALEVINWYLDTIQPKIREALFDCLRKDNAVAEAMPGKEYNGSAKVALICVIRSVDAWNVLEKYCHPLAVDIQHIKVVLEQLEKEVDYQFPYARTFLRPGFDTI